MCMVELASLIIIVAAAIWLAMFIYAFLVNL